MHIGQPRRTGEVRAFCRREWCRVTGWIVFFVCVAATAVSVAAWFAGYAVGVADGTRLLAEWCRRHMGEGDGE